MSWVRESNLTWVQRLAVRIITTGVVPKHIAFIMDGNRRFATKENMEKNQGHFKGFDKLSEVLQWCLDVGVNEVTVYAFSIENFKRSQDEVDTLLDLAREKFSRLMEEKDKLYERGICIRIIGNLSLLPEDLRQTIAEAMLITQDNRKAVLNVAFAYTSRDEIINSMKTILEGVNNKELDSCDINEELMTKCLYTTYCSEPDLLVRTSGETRLSDFLLWQISSTVVYFTETLWPEFTIWHLLAAIFNYQRNYRHMKDVRMYLNRSDVKTAIANNPRVYQFLENLENRRRDELLKLASSKKVTMRSETD